MESTLGTTESNTKAGGKMASSTAKASTGRMAATEEESGKTARESSGSVTKALEHKASEMKGYHICER